MYTIVFADDEEEVRQAIIQKVAWNDIGYEFVGEAGNGAEALELVEKLRPDVLLTDIQMPFISGIELARQVREIHPSTQIVFLSGHDDFTYAQKAIQYNIITIKNLRLCNIRPQGVIMICNSLSNCIICKTSQI